MIKPYLVGALSVASVAFTALSTSVSAAVINFDDQGFSGPDQFDLAGDAQTLNIDTVDGKVTFKGGVILTNATNLPANRSTTYATANNISTITNNPTRKNPLVIEFENPVTNFFLDVLNGVPVPNLNYTVADDIGNSSTFALASNTRGGFQKIGFQASGKRITITPDTSSAALEPRFMAGAYDFFIDNVTFNTALPGDLLDPIDEVVVPDPDPTPLPAPVPATPTTTLGEPPVEPSPIEIPGSEPTPVPEPTGVLSLLAAGAFGLHRKTRK